jgi:hypothetical protein
VRLRVLLRPLLLVGVSFLCASSVESATGSDRASPPLGIQSVVVSGVRVIDGQTIEAQVEDTRLAIRVSSVEAPPVNTPCGLAAGERLRALAIDGLRLSDDPTAADDQHTRVFRTVTPDGIRVWLDKALLLDAWWNQPVTAHTATAFVSAFEHDIVVKYYDATLDAVSRLSWQIDTASGPPLRLGWTSPLGAGNSAR